MKKTKRTIGILVSILVILVAALVAVSVINAKNAKQKEKDDEESIIHLGNIAGTNTFSVNFGGEGDVETFVLDGENWYWDTDRDLTMKQEKMGGIAEACEDITAVRRLEINEELSYYGLEDPMYTFSASDPEGHTLDLLIGSKLDGDRYYVMEPGGDCIYTIEDDLPKRLKLSFFQMVDVDDFTVLTEENILSLTVKNNKGEQLVFEQEGAGDTAEWIVSVNGSVPQKADAITVKNADGVDMTAQDALNAIFKGFTRSFFYECIDFNCTDAELKSEYGFDRGLEVTIKCVDEDEDTKEEVQKTFSIVFGDTFGKDGADDEFTYAKLFDSKQVNSMTTRRITPFDNALDMFASAIQTEPNTAE